MRGPRPAFEGLVQRESGCAFRCLAVPARQPLPERWRADYGFALVRRGIVVRQRVDSTGRATSIDIAGPGSALPIGAEADDGAGGYAVDDVMLCLCPTSSLDAAVASGAAGARDVVNAQATILRRVERIAEARSRASATSRVAAMLLAIGDTLSPGRALNIIPSAIQQRDLASLLALRHESVCRSVASLEEKHLVQRGDSGLTLVDRRALEVL
ncbi:hypothetical protein AKJ09_02483 [Labilithrix luteola]|uniref:HTH crp-type domain-containing protein n=1 Tax=Labilithrix luteola TaxID=1391654 RepID=A0A0K1PRR8_9BACT|nr:helix-turn-helix domain-containing protein [Labilithrix luteola]AKU95819.1 hypothetical protein AKJ09_02483 [Labilithrix luteola]